MGGWAPGRPAPADCLWAGPESWPSPDPARRPGWVFTRYQIVDAVHGVDHAVTERSVDVQIVGLRKKLGDAGEYIETVRGVGYRFRE